MSAASALVADEAALNRFATILDDASLLTGPERAEILQLLGVAPGSPEPDRLADRGRPAPRRHGHDARLRRHPAPEPDQPVQRGRPIPIWVRNDLPYPVNVVLFATPDDLRLDVHAGQLRSSRVRRATRA